MVRARLAASVGPGGHVWGGSQPVGHVLLLYLLPHDLLPTYFPALLQLCFFLRALLNSLGPAVLPLLLPASLWHPSPHLILLAQVCKAKPLFPAPRCSTSSSPSASTTLPPPTQLPIPEKFGGN